MNYKKTGILISCLNLLWVIIGILLEKEYMEFSAFEMADSLLSIMLYMILGVCGVLSGFIVMFGKVLLPKLYLVIGTFTFIFCLLIYILN